MDAWLATPDASIREFGPQSGLTACYFALTVFQEDGFGTQAAVVELTDRMPHLAGLDRWEALRLVGAWYRFGAWISGFDYPRSTLAVDAARLLLANTTAADLLTVGQHAQGAWPWESLTTEQIEYVEFKRFCAQTSIPAWTVLNSGVARAQAFSGQHDDATTTYLTSIASGTPLETDHDDLSWLLEHTGDRRMAASIAREGIASGRVSPDIGDRLLRRATRCEQPPLPLP